MATKGQQNVLSNIVLVILLNLLVKPFWVFYIDRVVQIQNGNTIFGIYGKYLSLAIVLNILLDMGMSNINQLDVAQDSTKMQGGFGKFWNAKLLLAAIYLIVLHIVFWALDSPRSEYGLFLMVVLIQVFSSLAIYLRSSVSGLHLFRYDAWLSVIDKFVVLVVATSLIYGMGRVIPVAVYAGLQAFGFLLVVVMAILLLGVRRRLWKRFSVSETRAALRAGLPFAVLILCMSIYTRFDFFLIERWAQEGARAAGEYMAAYRFIDIIGGVGFLFANILLSVFARNIAVDKSSQPTIDFYTLLFVGGGFILSSFLHYNSAEITDLLYREGVSSTSASLAVLIWSVPAVFLTNIYSSYLTAARDLRFLIIAALVAAVFYLGINISLLPSLGIMLTSYMSSITFWVLAIIFILRCGAKYKVSMSYPLVLIGIALLGLGANYWMHQRLDLMTTVVANVLMGALLASSVYVRLYKKSELG